MGDEKKGYRYKIPLEDRPIVVARYANGMMLKDLADEYGLTVEGVRRIIKKVDSSKLRSGLITRRERKIDAKKEAADQRSLKLWGMRRDEFKRHVAVYGGRSDKESPAHKFVNQRGHAGKRGIKWDLSFADWWDIWQKSGKWDQRGRSSESFVMARRGDLDTPYSKDTVYICTSCQNLKDGFISTPVIVRQAKRAKTLAQQKKQD